MQSKRQNTSELLSALRQYKEKFGNCDVPVDYEENPHLWEWVASIRAGCSPGKIPGGARDVVAEMDQLGFVWDYQGASFGRSWLKWFGQLQRFKRRFGHCNIRVYGKDIRLGGWVSRQRTQRKKQVLGADKIRLLDALGFAWSWSKVKFDETWLKWFCKLQQFKKRFGHCNVETGWKKDPRLAAWVSIQRVRHKKGRLTAAQVQQMDGLGFVWEWNKLRTAETWMKWYRELAAYAQEHGNPHVPRAHPNTKLASWVWLQRGRRDRAYAHGPPLTNEQISLLDKLGFRWHPLDEMWEARFEQLKRFKEQHGHLDPVIDGNVDPNLVEWVRRQRVYAVEDRLHGERKPKLDAIGFTWTIQSADHRWQEAYRRLKQYHSEHGHCAVPGGGEGPILADWVARQRKLRRQGLLSEERIRQMDLLGFNWKSRHVSAWDDRLAEVAAFKAECGHCEVPLGYSRNPSLGRFVKGMRKQRNTGKLSADRISQLDALGFAWKSSRLGEVDGEGINAAWQTRLDELFAYKQAHGNCDVPARLRENPQLGHWIAHQRQLRRSGKLHAGRQRRLDDIGFCWRSGRHKGRWASLSR